MLYVSQRDDPKPEKYSDYKNRTTEKLTHRFKDILVSVNSCSLKKEDKIKLFENFKKLLVGI